MQTPPDAPTAAGTGARAGGAAAGGGKDGDGREGSGVSLEGETAVKWWKHVAIQHIGCLRTFSESNAMVDSSISNTRRPLYKP